MSKAELKDFTFKSRHIGPTNEDEALMLQSLGYENSEEFISSVIPNEIFDSENKCVSILDGCDQNEALKEINIISKKNIENRSLIGLGYHSTVIPPVVQRNVLESPEELQNDPHGEGWLLIIRPDNPDQLQELMDSETYSKKIAS